MLDVQQVPSVSVDIDDDETRSVIEEFATQARRLLRHDGLTIWLLSDDGVRLEQFAVVGSEIANEFHSAPVADSSLIDVIRRNMPLISDDVASDERVRRKDGLFQRSGYHSLVSVPLRAHGRPYGFLNFLRRGRAMYTERDALVGQQIADQIGGFLHNMRLQRFVRASVRRDAVERERARVAREFHDTIAQQLAEILRSADRLAAAVPDPNAHAEILAWAGKIRHTHEEVRRSILDMTPFALLGRRLEDAMADVLADVAAPTRTSLTVEGDAEELPAVVRTSVFRVFQEAVENACKHAQAATIQVELSIGDELRLLVIDDGKGIAAESDGGFGTDTMRERAAQCGGELALQPCDAGGTAVELTIPWLRHLVAASHEPEAGEQVPAQSGIRVLLVDDHPAYRQGLREQLERTGEFRVVGEGATAGEAITLVRELQPDVLLLDCELPDRPGTELAAEIVLTDPVVTVVMMSAFGGADRVAAALGAGARAYLTKSSDETAIVHGIRAALDGATVVNSVTWFDLAGRGEEFSPRELHFLALMAAGCTNREIAADLHLAPKTAEANVAALTKKLGARNRTHAAALAVARRLVDPSSIVST